ncbi:MULTISPECIES: hypothetical protein [Streptomycetaceae]|nr:MULTISPECIES: hypothetical protein [Streptomycetaceae]MYS57926.1 hypothetical protein [Streptomyces sp. SID5468]
MDERHDPDEAAVHAAFEEILRARPEPALPGVVDAAVVGGRRIRRRRAALSAAGALAVVATAVTVAVGLSAPDGRRAPQPLAPIGSVTPHPTVSTPRETGTPEARRSAADAVPSRPGPDPRGTGGPARAADRTPRVR